MSPILVLLRLADSNKPTASKISAAMRKAESIWTALTRGTGEANDVAELILATLNSGKRAGALDPAFIDETTIGHYYVRNAVHTILRRVLNVAPKEGYQEALFVKIIQELSNYFYRRGDYGVGSECWKEVSEGSIVLDWWQVWGINCPTALKYAIL
ncbi:hypothetical protein SARC_03620 [Sphaeroforma arctica JP610]|uniref:Uncharacterized protein n=1 Tax=Sphaeroforma arctica JP610 TaxID=667725 RepID=A0A0L0G5G2_9EUKA|nr:hypothetical protein SARC_03620 [Sphaeroforma arctica JP610]KNC84164.1 hypothetical protein SARC_03620 [Sphaeroforma arctica JP610]|eukprot:XP_014158066.1 hypothetical protein SARC_03620 [Sphaeroforma arctica JP610]